MSKPDVRVTHLVPARFGSRGVVGGAERYALELARAMARQVPTTLVTFGPKDSDEMEGDLRIRVLGHPHYVRGQRNNPISGKLFDALRPATIVHCHQQHILASSTAAAYCRLTGRRVFVSDLGGGGWDLSAYVSTDRWYHGHLHLSRYSRHVFGHDGNPHAHVILGGVNPTTFSPGPSWDAGSRQAVRDSLLSELFADRDTALYVGRILPHKGINYLIEGLPPDVLLIVAGRPDDPRYLADLHRLAADKNVAFCHELDDAQLVQVYRDAFCVVLPSVYQTMYGQRTNVPELLGQTLLEGMACGRPVIGTNVASLPEIVDDGVTGFIVPPNDPSALGAKIAWLRTHQEEARAMGAAARRRVEGRFTWEAVVQRCLAAYGA